VTPPPASAHPLSPASSGVKRRSRYSENGCGQSLRALSP
jgi:hypothetical protein